MNLIITANSPGELYGWARPLVKRLKKDNNNIVLVLLPCTFSTGSEKEVALNILNIDSVVNVSEFLKFVFLGSPLKAFFEYPPHMLVHIGGDLFYAAILAKRFSISAVAYKWASKSWDKYFSGYFVPGDKFRDKMLKQGIEDRKIELTGELVFDSVFDELENSRVPAITGSPIICFMAGNRLKEIGCLVPFFMKVAELISIEFPEVSFIYPMSSFFSEESLRKVLSAGIPHGFQGTIPDIIYEDNNKYLKSKKGVKILLYKGGGCSAMKASDFVVTIPGTKTLEGAVLEKPMLVILPFNRADLVPFHGPLGLLDYIPFFGSKIKGQLLLWFANKPGHLALPNILAKRELVPELKDFLTPEMVACKIVEVCKDKNLMENISKELKELCSSMKGSSDRAVDFIKRVYERDCAKVKGEG